MADTPTMWIVNGTKRDAPDVGLAGITVDFMIRAFVSTAFNLKLTSVTVTDEHDVIVSSIERGKLYKVTGTVAPTSKDVIDDGLPPLHPGGSVSSAHTSKDHKPRQAIKGTPYSDSM